MCFSDYITQSQYETKNRNTCLFNGCYIFNWHSTLSVYREQFSWNATNHFQPIDQISSTINQLKNKRIRIPKCWNGDVFTWSSEGSPTGRKKRVYLMHAKFYCQKTILAIFPLKIFNISIKISKIAQCNAHCHIFAKIPISFAIA